MALYRRVVDRMRGNARAYSKWDFIERDKRLLDRSDNRICRGDRSPSRRDPLHREKRMLEWKYLYAKLILKLLIRSTVAPMLPSLRRDCFMQIFLSEKSIVAFESQIYIAFREACEECREYNWKFSFVVQTFIYICMCVFVCVYHRKLSHHLCPCNTFLSRLILICLFLIEHEKKDLLE